MQNINECKQEALSEALDSIKTHDQHKSIDNYGIMHKAVSKLAQILLIDRATRSSSAAIELAKMYQQMPQVDFNQNYQEILNQLDRIELNPDQLEMLIKRIDMSPRLDKLLSAESIKLALKNKQISISEAQSLMKIVNLDKTSENKSISITLNESYIDDI